MKKKVTISWLPIHLGFFFLLFSFPQLLFGQKINDSTHITFDYILLKPKSTPQLSPVNLLPEQNTVYPLNPAKQSDYLPVFSLKEEIRLPYPINPSPLFLGDYSTNGILKQFPHGAFLGSGSQKSLPGIGRFNGASFGYQHIFDEKLELQVRANAMKINMNHFAGQAFSTSGALLYHASDRVSFKLFGTYDIGNSYGMSTHQYGATVAFDMSERFGMEMGVQRYYDAMRGRWETVPVVIPYYRFEKFTLGLDVGGLIYEILRETVFKRRGDGSPTITPPRFTMPIK